MSKWAPEPWTATLGDDCTIVDANGHVIASVVCIDRSMDRATARVMTMAPKLYAALAKLVAACPTNTLEQLEAKSQGRLALTQAEGK